MAPKAKTGILGGSFNPPHLGHTTIAQEVLRQGLVTDVVMMVSPQNPLKDSRTLIGEDERLRLATLACEGIPHLHASGFEFSLPRPSYTWLTLRALTQAFPQQDFCLIIGADNWQIFPHWYKSKDIISAYNILIYPRKGFEVSTQELPPGVIYVDMPTINISSTEIRRRITKGEDASQLVAPRVWEEIVSNCLYTKKEHGQQLHNNEDYKSEPTGHMQ